MLLTLVGEELSSCEGNTWSNDAFNSENEKLLLSHTTSMLNHDLHKRWIVRQVEEETHSFHRAILLKVLFEEPCSLHVDLEDTTSPTNRRETQPMLTLTPMAANTMAKLSSCESITSLPDCRTKPPCLQIWAAI